MVHRGNIQKEGLIGQHWTLQEWCIGHRENVQVGALQIHVRRGKSRVR